MAKYFAPYAQTVWHACHDSGLTSSRPLNWQLKALYPARPPRGPAKQHRPSHCHFQCHRVTALLRGGKYTQRAAPQLSLNQLQPEITPTPPARITTFTHFLASIIHWLAWCVHLFVGQARAREKKINIKTAILRRFQLIFFIACMLNTKQALVQHYHPQQSLQISKPPSVAFYIVYLYIYFAQDMDVFRDRLVFMAREVLMICIRMQLDEKKDVLPPSLHSGLQLLPLRLALEVMKCQLH